MACPAWGNTVIMGYSANTFLCIIIMYVVGMFSTMATSQFFFSFLNIILFTLFIDYWIAVVATMYPLCTQSPGAQSPITLETSYFDPQLQIDLQWLFNMEEIGLLQ